MSSTLRDIADALADALDAEAFSSVTEQPSVERLNWPSYDVEQLVDPVIAVTPATMTVVRTNRTNHEYDYAVNVFLGRHAPTEALADGMLDLAEELVDVIRSHTYSASNGGDFPEGVTSPFEISVDMNPDEALQDRNVWRAVITVTYRTHRATS